jgi:Family of unknown function (DUF6056)
MSEKNRFWSSLPIIVLAGIALADLAYLGGYTRFMADDYCSAYYATRFGLFRSIWYWYINWSGRYTAFAFDWLTLTKTLGPYGAHLVPPIAIATWLIATIAAVYISLKAIAPRSAIASVAIAISASFVLAVIVLSPDIAQSYFWLNGMRSYSLPLVVMSIYALLFVWLVPRLKSNEAVWLTCIFAFGLTFANGGFSETMAALQPVMLIFITGLQWLSNDRKTDANFKVLAAATFGALLSLIMVAIAPGNALRKAQLPASPGLIKWMEISIGAYLAYLQDILFSPQRITALLGAILVSAWAGTGYKNQITLRWWTIPAQILGGLILSFVCIPPAVYGYAAPPPPRTLSIAAFALMTFWMVASFLIGSWLARTSRSSVRLEIGLIVLATLLIGVSSALTMIYVNQNRSAYIAYAQKWDAMDAQILQARANHQVFVNIPAMLNWAALERPNDHPKFWATACYSEYYGIQVYGPPY